MKRSAGITEFYWGTLNEDKRIFWRNFCRFLGVVAGLFVAKTGFKYFDWFIGVVTAFLPTAVIETQRTYSKVSPRLRKWITRAVIFLGSWAVALLGVAIFSQIGIVAVGSTFTNMLVPDLTRAFHWIEKIGLVVAFVIASFVAIFRVFRQVGIEELIYHQPRRGLINLLVTKPFKADTFAAFALFELTVMMVGFMYSSTVADVAKLYFSMLNIVSL